MKTGFGKYLGIALLTAVTVMAASCRLVSSVVHDDEVVAKVGKHRLYRTELESIVPEGISAEDSLNLVNQYIDTWASAYLFDELASNGLSKKDLDLSTQLEEYRHALVRYRYEQKYINERLDTLVSEQEVNAYYEEHQDRYILSYPIVKARFVRMRADSPKLPEVKELMASQSDEDFGRLSEIVATSAIKYGDFGGKWIDITDLAKEFGVDYGTLLALMANSSIQYVNGDGTLNYAFLSDYVRAGSIPPVEYCEKMIKEVIINSRKQALLNSLERDLLDDARSSGKLIIY